MADNLDVTPGTGATLRMVEKSAIKVQAVTLDIGAGTTETLMSAGSKAAADSIPVAQATEDIARIGIVTETAPGTDTASSGLNGRLQRIAQRLTSLIALLPAALGANGGLKIEGVASGTAVPVSGIVTPYTDPANIVSGAITTAMTGTTSTSLLAAPGTDLRNYITTVIVSNAHATVGTDLILQDGSGGTTLMTIPAGAVYGGAVISLPVPLRQPTANTALYCANVTTGASTKVSVVGYKAA